ncbi:hypothetical protein J6590_074518 [Homalodisca vitripennis]|nr:hypothetical protein J6590_074518 [Homalodisca vitripennis]
MEYFGSLLSSSGLSVMSFCLQGILGPTAVPASPTPNQVGAAAFYWRKLDTMAGAVARWRGGAPVSHLDLFFTLSCALIGERRTFSGEMSFRNRPHCDTGYTFGGSAHSVDLGTFYSAMSEKMAGSETASVPNHDCFTRDVTESLVNLLTDPYLTRLSVCVRDLPRSPVGSAGRRPLTSRSSEERNGYFGNIRDATLSLPTTC